MLAIVIIQVTHLAKRRGTQMKELRNAENDTFIASAFRGWHDYTYIYLLGSYHISYTYTCEYIIQIPIGIMILQAQFVHVSSCWPYEAECFHFVDVSCTSHMSTRAGKKDCHLTQCTNHLLTSTPHQFNTVRFFGGQNAKLHDPTVSSCFGIITKAIVPLWLFGNFS